jgi:hypothetical protein
VLRAHLTTFSSPPRPPPFGFTATLESARAVSVFQHAPKSVCGKKINEKLEPLRRLRPMERSWPVSRLAKRLPMEMKHGSCS